MTEPRPYASGGSTPAYGSRKWMVPFYSSRAAWMIEPRQYAGGGLSSKSFHLDD